MSNLPRKNTPQQQQLTGLDKPPSPLLSNIKSGRWLNEQEFPELEFIVPGIVPEGSTILVGPPKAGKSWLALNIALSVATGTPALGNITLVKPRPVLMFALEDSDRRMKDRISIITGNSNDAPENFYYDTHIDPNYLFTTIDQWLYEYGHQKPLVILDTLGKAMPPSNSNESAYQRDYRIGARLKKCVDDYPGSGLMMLHHDRKAETDDFVDAVSGTHGLAGSADTIIVLKRDRLEDEGFINVTGRDVEEKEYPVTRSQTGWEIQQPEDPNKIKLAKIRTNLGTSKQDLLDFIAEHGEVSTSLCTEKFGKNARFWLSQLAKSGKINKEGRGIYTWNAA